MIVMLLYLLSSVEGKSTEQYYPDYNLYHNYSAFKSKIGWMDNNMRRDVVRVYSTATSFRGEPLYLVKATNFNRTRGSNGNPKVKVLFSFGEHARELLPVELFLAFVQNITEGMERPCTSFAYRLSTYILDNVELHILPMINPDGRVKLESSLDYCWRGTAHDGVDLNRNFDWEFGGEGSSFEKNSEEYNGGSAFSEPESVYLRDLAQSVSPVAFVSWHSGIQHIYAPFADSRSRRARRAPPGLEDILSMANNMIKDVSLPFRAGPAFELNDYPADGVIFDYMSGVLKIPYSVAVELWGDGGRHSGCFDIFNPQSRDLPGVVADLMALVVGVFTHLVPKHVGVPVPTWDPPQGWTPDMQEYCEVHGEARVMADLLFK